jgi:peptidoglycan/xylan/chitin deacetylase (PgdA/CDA1 family)
MSKLQILIYHRVLDQVDSLRPGEMTAELFDLQMQTVARYFNPLSLKDGLSQLEAGTLPPRAVAITFDDGYKDNLTTATPILNKYKLQATVFVATGFLNGGIMWNDAIVELIRQCDDVLDLSPYNLGCLKTKSVSQKLSTIKYLIQTLKYCEPVLRDDMLDKIKSVVGIELPNNLMLTVSEVQKLSLAGIEIGAHTVNHPILSKLALRDAETEIIQSKLYLEGLLGKSVRYFAYPNGNPGIDYQLSHRNILRKTGFEAAFSTWWAAATNQMDKYQLPRFTPWDQSSLKFRLRMLQYRYKAVGRALKVR